MISNCYNDRKIYAILILDTKLVCEMLSWNFTNFIYLFTPEENSYVENLFNIVGAKVIIYKITGLMDYFIKRIQIYIKKNKK